MSNETNNGSAGSSYLTCDSPPSTERVIMTVYLVVVLVLTVAGNLLVISVVFTYQRLQQVTNYFIVSLAVSDLLVAALTLPLTIYANLHNGLWCLNLPSCGVYLVVDAICTCASIWNLVAISLDRLTAIKAPFRYRELVTRSKAVITLGILWVFSLIWGCLYLLNWQDTSKSAITITWPGTNIPSPCQRTEPVFYTVSAVVAFFFPLLIILTAYSFILKVAITQAKAVAALNPNRDQRKKTNFFREVKATKTVALVVGAFVIAWLPVFVLLMLSTWDTEAIRNLKENHPKTQEVIFFLFLRILPPLSFCVNPIIYGVFNSSFRSAFLKFLHCPQRMDSDFNSHSMTTSRPPQRPSYSTMVADKSEAGNNNIAT